jgi:hypothetical protein
MMTLSNKEVINEKAELHLKSMINLAETITASSSDGQAFPFVRVPKFELLGSHIRSIVSADVTIWAPLVTEDQREEWSKFSASEMSWYNESLSILQVEQSTSTDLYAVGAFRDEIWEGPDLNDTSYVAAAVPGPFAPLWQISPPTMSISSINYNLLHEEHIRNIFPAFIEANDCVMSAAKSDTEALSKSIVDSQDSTSEFHPGHPHTIQLTPVSGQLDDKNITVGFILSTIHWGDFLAGVFTTGTNGVIAVIRNTCNQSMTYEVKNGQVCHMFMSGYFPKIHLSYLFIIFLMIGGVYCHGGLA